MRPTTISPLHRVASSSFPMLSGIMPMVILSLSTGLLATTQTPAAAFQATGRRDLRPRLQEEGQGFSHMTLLVTPQHASNTNALPTRPAPVSDVGGAPPVANARSFAGTYSDGQLTVTLTGSGDAYTGLIQLEDQKYQLAARLAGGRLEGTFESEGQKFSFTAALEDSTLTLATDGRTYTLKKRGVNPLTAAPVNPLAREPQSKRPLNPLTGASVQSGTKPAPPSPAAKAPVKFTRLSVRDPGVNNIEAVSFLIPAGWKTEGGIQWFPQFRIQAYLVMKITEPQTGAAIELLPIQNFVWLNHLVGTWQPGTNYMGDIFWPPIMDIPQFIRSFYTPSALRHLQNARVVTSEDLPKLAALLAQANEVPTARYGRVRFEYQVGSQTWEEDVYAGLTFMQHQLGINWSVLAAYSFRAPKGQLDGLVPVMNTTINTMRITPEWFGQYGYVQQLFFERMRQGIRDAGALSAHIARNTEEIRQMFAESYNRSCQAQDRMARGFTEYIRGVDTYRNPYEDRPVQLPSGYDQVWVNRLGEYILSNQAGFDPNTGSNNDWRRLEKGP